MCPALKEIDSSSNQSIKYCTFCKEGIKVPTKKGENNQIHLGIKGSV